MRKPILLFFFLLSVVFLYNIKSSCFSYKTISSYEQESFQKFCNTALQNYVTTDEEKSFLNGWTVSQYLQSLPKENKYSRYIFACFKDNECIAFQILRINPSYKEYADANYLYNIKNPDSKDYNHAFIEVTFVKPNYRRQGIASQFINMTYNKCKELAIKQLVRVGKSYNTPTIHLYNKLKFQQLDPTKRTLWTRHSCTNQKIKDGDILVFEKKLD